MRWNIWELGLSWTISCLILAYNWHNVTLSRRSPFYDVSSLKRAFCWTSPPQQASSLFNVLTNFIWYSTAHLFSNTHKLNHVHVHITIKNVDKRGRHDRTTFFAIIKNHIKPFCYWQGLTLVSVESSKETVAGPNQSEKTRVCCTLSYPPLVSVKIKECTVPTYP